MLKNVELLYKLRDAIKYVGPVAPLNGVPMNMLKYDGPVCLMANCHARGVLEYDLALEISIASGFEKYFGCRAGEASDVVYGYNVGDIRRYHETGADYAKAINNLLSEHGYEV